ncbi:MAG: c-type cytochrome [Oligoflexia bacterium]|nr:c-type cytochrome [Oligoflexia bacterium]
MKLFFKITLTLLILIVFGAAVALAEHEGLAKYKYFGCASCHSVKSAGIEITDPSAKNDSLDLSTVGKDHNKEWLSNYLKKKEEVNGKTHPKVFMGTKEEREVISDWLSTLK